jgi:hypothetical protein
MSTRVTSSSHSARRRRYVIRGQRQLRALASPARQAIVDVVTANGPCSVREIAGRLARPASALYHHVRALRAVGLLAARPGPAARGRPGTLVDVPGRPMVIHYEPGQAHTRRPMRQIVAAMSRAASRDFVRGYRPGVVVSGDLRQLWAARSQVWVTDKELGALNRLLRRLFQHAQSDTRRPGPMSRPHSLTVILAPTATESQGIGARARKRSARP